MMQKCNKSKKLIELESQFLSVLAQKTRLKLICLLKDGPKCLCEFAPIMDEDVSTISRHLNQLKDAGILESHKEGVRIIYWIKDEKVIEILDIVDEMLKSKIEEELSLMTNS